jgi:hypothetical protein
MKANELRIGNLVTYENKTHKIFGISEQYPFLDTIEYGAFVVEWYDLKPIPLTEDWLLKAGFEVVYDSEFTKRLDFIKDNRFDFFINKQNETLSGIRFKGNTFFNEAKHVHQLQNIYFALTGEELAIA